MRKELIRKSFSNRRNLLNYDDFEKRTKLLIKKTIELITQVQPKCVHCFLPIESKLEINTFPIIEFCLSQDIQVVVPVTNFSDNTMKSANFNFNTLLTAKKYNIPEPINPSIVNDEIIDFVITPLLAFDLNGFRVGYGKGFYDRFFNLINPKSYKVGLSLFDPIIEIKDVNEHDICLTHCITSHEIYTF
ncbi:MAG: 5-formyltetrahydrofolate cyclo-ligase [Flavobacteriales bacterium]|nr:5-formyltetrahydrofolate cyclo-ligase [Flavobacteriales bacterium]